ncbi:MAG: triose-phosphate isomerase [Candidatus Paceibacterota bacterium]|jgi:triosephosphate isomerase
MSKFIVANWKMNPQSQKEAEILFRSISTLVKNIKNTKVIICPSFTHLFISQKIKSKKIILGAQNVAKEIEGSHTGEVSPKMLKNMGVCYVIVGHSERRSTGESNENINKKILNLLKYKISPILCVGENKRDHDGFYLSYVGEQIKECLSGVTRSQVKNIIIAYEPVWAIGKSATREATKEEFMEMKIFIKKVISDIYDTKIAHSISILYGGSVNSQNAKTFAIEGGADGLLIGRDSLNSKKLGAILSAIK